MTAWAQIVQMLDRSPAAISARKYTIDTSTKKRCQACDKIKLRTEFYARPSHSPNSVSAKCIECHLQMQRAKNAAKREARAARTLEQKQAEADRVKRRQKDALTKQPTGKFKWPEDE